MRLRVAGATVFFLAEFTKEIWIRDFYEKCFVSSLESPRHMFQSVSK